MQRIIIHWSAGTHTVSVPDRRHYHYIIDDDGDVHAGIHPPEANRGPLVSGRYAAHTLNCNTGSIGVAFASMAGAVERPFSAGRYSIPRRRSMPWPHSAPSCAAGTTSLSLVRPS